MLFLLVGLLGIILPRISLDENLGSVGRRMVGTVRSLQSLAMMTQKRSASTSISTRGLLAVILDGNEEKDTDRPHLGHAVELPEPFAFQTFWDSGKKESGRVDLSFYPTGRIDPATMHLMDERNNILAIAIEPVTGAIRMSDERIEPPSHSRFPIV